MLIAQYLPTNQAWATLSTGPAGTTLCPVEGQTLFPDLEELASTLFGAGLALKPQGLDVFEIVPDTDEEVH